MEIKDLTDNFITLNIQKAGELNKNMFSGFPCASENVRAVA